MNHLFLRHLLLLFLILPVLAEATRQDEGSIHLAQADTLQQNKEYQAAAAAYQLAWDAFGKEKAARGLAKCFKGLLYCWMKEKKFTEMIDFGKSVAEEIKKYESKEPALFARGHIYLAYACYRTNQTFARLVQYEKAIELFEFGKIRNRHLSSCYLNAAQIYLRRMDYPKAKSYLYLALERDPEKRYEADIYSQLSHCHFLMEEYEEALSFREKGFPMAKNPTVIGAYHSITAGIFIHDQKLEEATAEAKKALMYHSESANDYESRIRMNSLLSQIAWEQKEEQKAKQYFAKGLAELNAPGIPKNREGARLHVEYARALLQQGPPAAALHHHQQALAQLLPNIDTTGYAFNPPATDLYPETWLMTTFFEKAKALTLHYKQSQQVEDLQIAKTCFQLALATIAELRKNYGTETSKLLIGEYGQEGIEAAIDNAYRLFQITKEQSALKEMFDLMTTSRANLLNEALQKNKAILLATIPEPKLQAEKNARAEIAAQRKTIIATQLQTDLDAKTLATKLSKLERALEQKELQYDDLLRAMGKAYPAFASLYDQPVSPSVDQMQKECVASQTGVLSFFTGQKNWYVLLLQKEKLSVIRLPEVKTLEESLFQYLALLKASNGFVQKPQAARQLGYQLYQGLGLEKLLAAQKLNHLIVLPDGLLNSLPLEALVLNSSGSYFLEAYSTQYLPSLALLDCTASPQNKLTKRVFFDPKFSNGSRDLAPLNFGPLEISSLSNVQVFSESAASLAAFKEWAPQSRLLHLSTHAEASGGTPRIELADTTCYLPEIYALDIAAELVVLSACETNLGTIKKGEGVFSLARGFLHSGAQSLVSSQWQVNERTTADVINYFYEELQKGQTKAQALRAAKLRFLATSERDVYRTPYYWAGLTFIGADGTMDLNSNWGIGSYLTALVLLLILFGVFRFFRKRY